MYDDNIRTIKILYYNSDDSGSLSYKLKNDVKNNIVLPRSLRFNMKVDKKFNLPEDTPEIFINIIDIIKILNIKFISFKYNKIKSTDDFFTSPHSMLYDHDFLNDIHDRINKTNNDIIDLKFKFNRNYYKLKTIIPYEVSNISLINYYLFINEIYEKYLHIYDEPLTNYINVKNIIKQKPGFLEFSKKISSSKEYINYNFASISHINKKFFNQITVQEPINYIFTYKIKLTENIFIYIHFNCLFSIGGGAFDENNLQSSSDVFSKRLTLKHQKILRKYYKRIVNNSNSIEEFYNNVKYIIEDGVIKVIEIKNIYELKIINDINNIKLHFIHIQNGNEYILYNYKRADHKNGIKNYNKYNYELNRFNLDHVPNLTTIENMIDILNKKLSINNILYESFTNIQQLIEAFKHINEKISKNKNEIYLESLINTI